jgi:large subunit ribosomal protein L17
MRHLKSGRKLKRTSSHRKALLRNLASALFEHKKIGTTVAKAKELRPFAEQLITKAKHAIQREKQGILPEGQTIDVHSRRIVYKDIKSKAIVQELFDTIAATVLDRPGGYTRIVKTGFRRGDGGASAIIELVDWSAPVDGAASMKERRKAATRQRKPKAPKPKEIKEGVVEAIEEEPEEIEEEVVEEASEEEAETTQDEEDIAEEAIEPGDIADETHRAEESDEKKSE